MIKSSSPPYFLKISIIKEQSENGAFLQVGKCENSKTGSGEVSVDRKVTAQRKRLSQLGYFSGAPHKL